MWWRAPRSFLLGPVLHNPDDITGGGQDTRVIWGCVLDAVNALTAIGSAVALFPVVTPRQDYPGTAGDSASLTATGHALVQVRDWTFLLGPGLVPATNALLLGSVIATLMSKGPGSF